MRITLARHGETIENRDRTIQGQNHGQLTGAGYKQAKELAKKLRLRNFDVVYCSDLLRCVDTARPILATRPDTPIHYTDKLREISFGEYQGRPSKSLDWPALEGNAVTKKAPGGESWTDLTHRVVPYINKIYAEHGDQNVLVVTHGGPMRVIRAAVGGVAIENFISTPIPNCATWDFEMTHMLSEEVIAAASGPSEN